MFFVAMSLAMIGGSAVASNFELTVHMAAQRPQELDALFWRVSNPTDSLYGKYRTAHALRDLAGASTASIKEVSSWLSGLGGMDIGVNAMGDRVTASFNASSTSPIEVWSARGLPTTKPAVASLVTRRDFSRREEAARSRDGYKAGRGYSINAQKQAYGIDLSLSASDERTTQMVWGPGTFGYSPSALRLFKLEEQVPINLDKIHFDTANHGQAGGDNFGEGSLDVRMISSFGLNATACRCHLFKPEPTPALAGRCHLFKPEPTPALAGRRHLFKPEPTPALAGRCHLFAFAEPTARPWRQTLVSNTNTSMSTEEGEGFGLAFLDFVSEVTPAAQPNSSLCQYRTACARRQRPAHAP